MVEVLMETNGGCELPCWWGIVPGETTWEETKAFVSPFALSFELPYPDGNYIQYGVVFPISESERLFDNKLVTFWVEKPGNVVEMIVAGKEYSLVNFLKKFGKPDQILFRSPGLPAMGPPQFELTLIYREKGIVAHKRGFGTLLEGEEPLIEICPENIDPIRGFYMWSPENDEIVDQVIIPRITTPGTSGQQYPIRQLEDVTNFDIDSFNTTFSDSDATECIEAPLGIWP